MNTTYFFVVVLIYIVKEPPLFNGIKASGEKTRFS